MKGCYVPRHFAMQRIIYHCEPALGAANPELTIYLPLQVCKAAFVSTNSE